jgi:hypothetical protein
MGYEGWLSLAGTEIVNNERVRAYAASMVPMLQMPNADGCESAPDALHRILDDEEYRTPLLDDAPWTDPDDPDTYDFCGVLGLGVTGLIDSTRTGTVVESTADGGGIVGRRRATRAVRVSALLVGATQASVEAGQQWLNAAMEGDCDGDCNGSDLCFLQALVDPQDWGDVVTDTVALTTLEADSGHWTTSGATPWRWNPTTLAEEIRTKKFTPPLPCDEIVWTWTLKGVPGTQVNLRSYSENGLAFSDVVTIDSDGYATRSVSDRGQGRTVAYCALRLPVGDYVDIRGLTVSYRDTAVNTACFDHYQRTIREVSCIDGPTTVNEYAPNNGAMRHVEFTLTSGRPWVFGSTRRVVLDRTLNKVGGDQTQDTFKLKKTIPVPAAPAKPTLVLDPTCPKVPPPPRASAVFTDCTVSASWFVSYGVAIPGSMIPLWHDAVPTMSVLSGTVAARGVRVRFFPRPLGDLQDTSDLDEHSACGQFVIDYIPANSSFTLDGQTQHASLKVPGKPRSSADHLLSGPVKGALFEWPVLTCGTDYVMVLDVDGEAQSVTGISLVLAARY